MEDKDERRKRLAAARQARYRARKGAEGLLFGVTITKKDREAVSAPKAQRALALGRELGPALTQAEMEVFRLGRKVHDILKGGGPTAWTLKKLLDL